MNGYRLQITLLSDATFGRGDGVAGVVAVEVQHDADGFPYLGGRTLKGLLGAEGADIVFALSEGGHDRAGRWQQVEERLFGASGGNLSGQAILRIGPARLPADLRAAVAKDIHRGRLTRSDVLETLTALRRQTAMDPESGAPLRNTLRTMRVILRGTVFEAPLTFLTEPTDDDLAFWAACVKALRRAGTGRNRGRGRLKAELFDAGGQAVTETHFAAFRKAVAG